MILVVGGTGDLGGRGVDRLCQRVADVRCLIRSGSHVQGLEAVGAGAVVGDLTDRQSLDRACQGAAVVVATATSIARHLEGRRTPSMHAVHEVGMCMLVEAAEQAGVRRFVYVSYAGVDAAL